MTNCEQNFYSQNFLHRLGCNCARTRTRFPGIVLERRYRGTRNNPWKVTLSLVLWYLHETACTADQLKAVHSLEMVTIFWREDSIIKRIPSWKVSMVSQEMVTITIFLGEVSIMKSSIGFHWSGQSLEMVSVFRGENNCERARCNAAGHPGDNYAQY